MAKRAKAKKVVVNAKFLNGLADDIYNPKTKKHLRLCAGTLQNGPDPEDANRPMHCGLGELWFAMTGTQPGNKGGVTENKVIDKAVDLSKLGAGYKVAEATIRKLKLSDEDKEQLIDALSDCKEAGESEFRSLLDSIPDENDDETHEENRTPAATYKSRARGVAQKLREAAKLLDA